MSKVFPIAVAALACSALSAFGGGNGHNGGSVSGSGGGHHASSAPSAGTAVSPRISGMPHSSGSMPASFKPTISYSNGTRSLNYPPVGVSNVQHSRVSSGTGSYGNARIVRSDRATLQFADKHSPHGSNHPSPGGGKLAGKPGNPQHAGAINLATHTKLDPQSAARLRHWNGNRSSTAQAHWNCHHHNHNWWRHHCITFVFFDFGWWGWYDGWWYPDPYYYNGADPIYGYGDLSPEQIVASVQVALQQQGYYSYAIDGQMGPQTRAALGQYQADHRLPITYGVDPATLGSLGVIR